MLAGSMNSTFPQAHLKAPNRPNPVYVAQKREQGNLEPQAACGTMPKVPWGSFSAGMVFTAVWSGPLTDTHLSILFLLCLTYGYCTPELSHPPGLELNAEKKVASVTGNGCAVSSGSVWTPFWALQAHDALQVSVLPVDPVTAPVTLFPPAEDPHGGLSHRRRCWSREAV